MSDRDVMRQALEALEHVQVERVFDGLDRDYKADSAISALRSALAQEEAQLCEDCPPADYPTDKTRCTPCPRRKQALRPGGRTART
jgi:hypothetical protein